MRRWMIWTLLLIFASVPALAALTDDPMVDETPVKMDCVSAILAELDSGQVIFAENADEMRPVASVTKVMTILLALEAVDQGRATLDEEITVSKNASGMGGSQILLDTGEIQTYAQLLKSVIVGSAIVRLAAEYGTESVPYVRDYVTAMKQALAAAE